MQERVILAHVSKKILVLQDMDSRVAGVALCTSEKRQERKKKCWLDDSYLTSLKLTGIWAVMAPPKSSTGLKSRVMTVNG